MVQLAAKGWRLEHPFDVGAGRRPGKFDAVFETKAGPFAFEWETGNISSSHRALNKMALGIIQEKLIGGTLVVPTRALYQYLTDRVGNYAELVPYFELWRSIRCPNGILEIVAIEHDATSMSVPRIPKGTSGRAIE